MEKILLLLLLARIVLSLAVSSASAVVVAFSSFSLSLSPPPPLEVDECGVAPAPPEFPRRRRVAVRAAHRVAREGLLEHVGRLVAGRGREAQHELVLRRPLERDGARGCLSRTSRKADFGMFCLTKMHPVSTTTDQAATTTDKV